ncbi:hypothetical protein [Streptomyces sp. NPDC058252]|uniref:DUF7239 family protein n=1 Tax=Streptomyces sp. NPDC058252 TaxID=3346405 RepID=UPI0036EE113A
MNTPMTEDLRFERLPRWVQSGVRSLEERVRSLEQELATARALLNDGPEDANVVVDPYSDNRQPLFDRPTVAFQFKAEGERFERYFLVRLMDDNLLEIHASSSIVLHPRSGNAVHVEVLER